LYVYGFSIARVQRYLLASPRLRDIQGGSELLEELCGSHFDAALAAAGIDDPEVLSRAASSVRVASADRAGLERLAAIWPMRADQVAPGAELYQALVPIEPDGGLVAAQRALGERLRAARATPPCDLPAVGPLVFRDRRTGLPAERIRRVGGGPVERIDRATDAKGRAWRRLREAGQSATLDRRCLAPDTAVRFARGGDDDDEDSIALESGYVACVHADGNAIGQAITRLLQGRQDAGRFASFSRRLSEATEAACARAVADVLEPRAVNGVLPARPVLLGGDDLTFLCAAECAVDFARAFCEGFERETREGLRDLIEGGLTASAGVALVKRNFPFDRAHALAESLTAVAKRHGRAAAGAGRPPSMVSFVRVTSSLPDDADALFEGELTHPSTGRLTYEAYRVGDRAVDGIATLDALLELRDALARVPRGPARQLLNDLARSRDAANESLERILELAERRKKQGVANDLRRSLEYLVGGDGPWREGEPPSTPLLDAYLLRELQGRRAEVRS
jgi:hypothetical protein